MNFVKRKLFKWVLPGLVHNSCESTIPRSGEEGENVNCFIVAFDRKYSPYFVTKSYSNDRLEGLKWNGERAALLPEQNQRVLIEMIDKYCIAIEFQGLLKDGNKSSFLWMKGKTADVLPNVFNE